ncbi:hypothetical protein ILYODFUR_003167 [Ilyodon furcidens]|uniref:Uncharacterized protein n=1 Tax=Ilyodon furcidens TaxID=33524 RepID=A0ABV0SI47_9TELE
MATCAACLTPLFSPFPVCLLSKKNVKMKATSAVKQSFTRKKVSGQDSVQVEEEKYLGQIMDTRLTFESYIKEVVTLAKANVCSFRMIRDCLLFPAANVFMHAMIFFSTELLCNLLVVGNSHNNQTTKNDLQQSFEDSR